MAGSSSRSLAAACDDFVIYDALPGVPVFEPPGPDEKPKRRTAKSRIPRPSPGSAGPPPRAAGSGRCRSAWKDDADWLHNSAVKAQMKRMDRRFRRSRWGSSRSATCAPAPTWSNSMRVRRPGWSSCAEHRPAAEFSKLTVPQPNSAEVASRPTRRVDQKSMKVAISGAGVAGALAYWLRRLIEQAPRFAAAAGSRLPPSRRCHQPRRGLRDDVTAAEVKPNCRSPSRSGSVAHHDLFVRGRSSCTSRSGTPTAGNSRSSRRPQTSADTGPEVRTACVVDGGGRYLT